MATEDRRHFTLQQDEELRVEVECDEDEFLTLELKRGTAEIFGTELVLETIYKFSIGSKFALFTYHGCVVEIKGRLGIQPYVSKETPMIMYLNTHAVLEELRNEAEDKGLKGPVMMVVGPSDVGKSSFCRLLLNYAVRMGRNPIFVDLDVGQGRISLPGTVGSILVERTSLISEDEMYQSKPIVYHFGHHSPQSNPAFYGHVIGNLAQSVKERFENNQKVSSSGVIIDTCGWVRGEGFDLIKAIAVAFEVDIVTVLDDERIFSYLDRDRSSSLKVIWHPKSGGVVRRSSDLRMQEQDLRIQRYFYGYSHKLFPHSFDIKFSDLKDKIYRVGKNFLPGVCVPFGITDEESRRKFYPVPITMKDLLNHLLSVSFTTKVEELTITNIAGFICVTDINMSEEKITILSPQPKPLPKTLLLLTEIKYVDSL